ncbi:MAG TPA: hypothetical protein VKZ98_06350 [Aquaticitalea sp.]|nr:hypothetical protein [Aquaticitalea sp.]
MDGVRIYFAAYGENETNGMTGQATVFMVPTGVPTTAEASVLYFMLPPNDGGDILGAPGLNRGGEGDPPGANYPQ